MKTTREKAVSSLKVLGWSVGSAIVGAVIVWFAELPIESQYLFLVPLVNSLLYTLKEFFEKHKA